MLVLKGSHCCFSRSNFGECLKPTSLVASKEEKKKIKQENNVKMLDWSLVPDLGERKGFLFENLEMQDASKYKGG